MMKKLTAILLCMAMLCTFAIAETIEIPGVWYLTYVEMADIRLNAADLGEDMLFELNADGTGTNTWTGVATVDVEWVLEGDKVVISSSGVAMDYFIVDGMLVNYDEESGYNLYYTREKPVASYVPAAPIAAEDIAQFNGTWTAEMCNLYGATLPFSELETLGMTNPVIVIEDGVVTRFGEEPETGEFANGILSVHSTVENDTDNIFASNYTLLEDGTLRAFYLGIYFYCSAN